MFAVSFGWVTANCAFNAESGGCLYIFSETCILCAHHFQNRNSQNLVPERHLKIEPPRAKLTIHLWRAWRAKAVAGICPFSAEREGAYGPSEKYVVRQSWPFSIEGAKLNKSHSVKHRKVYN